MAASRGTTHVLTSTFYAGPGGPVVDPPDAALTVLRDGQPVVGPITPPTLLRDGPGLYRWVWRVPLAQPLGTYVAAWSGTVDPDGDPSVGYQRFEVIEHPDLTRGPALVEPDALRDYLTRQGATGRALGLVEEAAAQASAYVGAHCSRLRPGDPAPMIVSRVALAVAARMAQNPASIRSVSAEGQSTDLPPAALTYWESTLLAPFRRRSA